MEIIDFLNLSVRRVVALVTLGLLVAIPTTAVLLRSPVRYQSTVTVRLGALLPDGGAFYVFERLAQDFQVALQLPQTADKVAIATGTDSSVVASGLTTALPSSGDVITVRFTGTDATHSLAVARAAASSALKVLTSHDVDEAAARVNASNRVVDQALADFQNYVDGSGEPDPLTSADAASKRLLLAQRQAANGTGGSAAATQVAQARAELDALAAVAPEFRRVSESVATARASAQQATFAQVAAASTDAAASSGSLVTVTGSTAASRTAAVVTAGFAAGAGAIMAAIAVLAALELRRSRKITQVALTVTRAPAVDGTEADIVWRSYRRISLRTIVEALTRWPTRTFRAAWRLVVPAGLIVTVGVVALLDSDKAVLALVLAVPLGLAFAALAMARFEVFLIGLIVVRASLDAFNIASPDGGSTGIDPGVVLGGVFIVCGTLWLLAQRRSGHWIPISRPTWALWGFAGACVASLPTSVAFSGSLTSTTKVIAGVLMFAVLEQYLGRRPERARSLLIALFASFVVPAIAALAEWVRGEGNTYLVDVSRVAGTFVHPASLADYLLFVLPISVLLIGWCRGRQRVVMVTITAVATGLLILTYTRAAWFAAILSFAYLAVRWRRELLYAMVAGIALLLVAVPSFAGRFADLNADAPAVGVPSNSLSWRIGYWERLVPQTSRNPITGLGFDSVQRTTPERLQPHNVFVQAYVETGLVGLASILAIIWTFSKMLRERLRRASSGWPRLLALAATSTAIATVAQFPSENLITQTFAYWYLAVAMTYGIRFDAPEAPRPGGTDGDAGSERALVGAST